MWVMLTTGALSIVERRDIAEGDPNVMVVRSRRKEWLNTFRTRYCPELTKPVHVDGRDYQWRAYGTRQDVAIGVGKAALDIHYSNFKSATGSGKFGLRSVKLRNGLESAYHKVWSNILDAGDGTSVYDWKYKAAPVITGIEACYRWGHLWDKGQEKCRDCGEPNPNFPDEGPNVKPVRPAGSKGKSTGKGKSTKSKDSAKSSLFDDLGIGTGLCSGSWALADKSTKEGEGEQATVICGVCHNRQRLSDGERNVRTHMKRKVEAA